MEIDMNTQLLKQQIDTLKDRQTALQEQLDRSELCLLIQSGAFSPQKVAQLIQSASNVVPLPTPKKGATTKGRLMAAGRTSKKTTNGPSKKTASRGTQTTVAASVPTLTERLKVIMGSKASQIDEILTGLRERDGWFPTSKSPRTYIAAHMSQNKDFVNVGRGIFAVAGTKAAEKRVETPKKEAAAKLVAKTQVKAPVKAKASPKVAKAPKTKKALSKVISDQRKAVASGEVPSLKNRLVAIIGDKEMKVAEVIEELKKRESDGWLPKAEDLNTYMSYALGSAKDTFERVDRGKYRLVNPPGGKAASKASDSAAEPKKEPVKAKATNGTPNKTKTQDLTNEEVEAQLAELENDSGEVLGNPFV
jgi:hypothetical protein